VRLLGVETGRCFTTTVAMSLTALSQRRLNRLACFDPSLRWIVSFCRGWTDTRLRRLFWLLDAVDNVFFAEVGPMHDYVACFDLLTR